MCIRDSGGLVRAMIEADGHTRQVIEEGFEVVVEQRQPMLLAGVAVAGAHRLIERVVGGAAEQLDIARAEKLLGLLTESDLAHPVSYTHLTLPTNREV